MPLGIGWVEILIVLFIVLIIFGPKRLPGLGRSLGTSMREFKDSVTGKDGDADAPREELDAPAGGADKADAAADAAPERAAKS